MGTSTAYWETGLLFIKSSLTSHLSVNNILLYKTYRGKIVINEVNTGSAVRCCVRGTRQGDMSLFS